MVYPIEISWSYNGLRDRTASIDPTPHLPCLGAIWSKSADPSFPPACSIPNLGNSATIQETKKTANLVHMLRRLLPSWSKEKKLDEPLSGEIRSPILYSRAEDRSRKQSVWRIHSHSASFPDNTEGSRNTAACWFPYRCAQPPFSLTL